MAVILYLDTSSLVKLYVEEAASADVEGLAGLAEVILRERLAAPVTLSCDDVRLQNASQREKLDQPLSC